jgi:hypothetical protein
VVVPQFDFVVGWKLRCAGPSLVEWLILRRIEYVSSLVSSVVWFM